MSTSENEDQNQGYTPDMEDSSSMTVEFLRARLLSERSISRAARQRADELAKRVAELEKQLKIVSLQRKKAEKATETVLAILENLGVVDASDDFDSSSDQGTALCESNVSDCKDECKEEEASLEGKMEMRGVSGEAYSSSEIDFSLPFGRTLSWKSGRSSPQSLARKKYADSSRRSSSSASTASSSKGVAKSCRRIRRRETISDETNMEAARDNLGNTHDQNLHGEAGNEIVEHQKQEDNSILSAPTHEVDKDMEKALQHQAELIGQYEAEERSQREWEEKFREDSRFVAKSNNPFNHNPSSSNLQKPGNTSGGKVELSLGLHETNQNVRNTLKALEQAKISLREELNSTSCMEKTTPRTKFESFPVMPSPTRLLGPPFPNNHALFSSIGFSASIPVKRNMISPSMCFSTHDDHIRPDMYR